MSEEEENDKNEQCRKAATVMAEADILLLVTGAGFSADSGLAVYGDIAQVEAYRKEHLEYHDLCMPHILGKDPELFYGFWGQCMNDYRKTRPHGGYEILRQWRDRFNARPIATDIQQRITSKYQQDHPFEDEDVQLHTPYQVEEVPKAFHVFTSNVDAHSYDYFLPEEIHDCHGNIELWQCSDPDCETSGIWRAPLEKEPFLVDATTMRAPQQKDSPIVENSKEEEESVPATRCDESDVNTTTTTTTTTTTPKNVAHIGQTKGLGERTDALKFMPEETIMNRWTQQASCNWPKCHDCDNWARPAILMFGDFGWKYDESQQIRWDTWIESVLELCAEQERKVCILEIGCGFNVPTCRRISEEMVEQVRVRGSDVTLVRVNPNEPFAPKESISEEHTIPIMSGGLEAIEKMNEAMLEILDEQA